MNDQDQGKTREEIVFQVVFTKIFSSFCFDLEIPFKKTVEVKKPI